MEILSSYPNFDLIETVVIVNEKEEKDTTNKNSIIIWASFLHGLLYKYIYIHNYYLQGKALFVVVDN